MTSINPFSGYVAQAASVERTAAADKSRQGRRSADLAKALQTRDDEMEHQVESADSVTAIHNEDASHHQHQPRQHHQTPVDEEPPHLDLKA